MLSVQEALRHKVLLHLQAIYKDVALPMSVENLCDELIDTMDLGNTTNAPESHKNLWSEQDVMLITYGDSVMTEDEKPLQTLRTFLNAHLKGVVTGVHILPFFPFSSDDGFAVMDYSSVNEALGDWQDVEAIASDFQLMADLVINHCSSRSLWFDNFVKGEGTGHDFFFTTEPDQDLSMVVRPRTSPLLRAVETANGTQHVWCTFSHDQVDLDFRNPQVLLTFVSIIRQYLNSGVKVFRLDAVAFLWKIPGSSSINLPQTHEAVRLLRTLIEHADPEAIIITETNIPNRENLAYFGNANEAHCIYNFSLPPLLAHTLLTGDCTYLKQWMMSMPPAQFGTAYFNFIASHDGIGLRPAEGLLSEDEVDTLANTAKRYGGRVSWRTSREGKPKPYELNIALYDLLQGTMRGQDKWGQNRFVCAHAIMLGLEGIPGIYIHSMLATGNDYEKLEHTQHNRHINRHRWQKDLLEAALQDKNSQHAQVLARLSTLINIRKQQPAFHPNATQFTLQLGDELFGFWRQSMDRRQSIFCISNITDKTITLPLSEVNLIGTDHWRDLIGGTEFDDLDVHLDIEPYQTLWITNSPADD